MAFCELHFFSEALGTQTAAQALLPEGKGRGPFPVLYLLHGIAGDHTIWRRRTSIERYAEPLPLIVVMPGGGRGFFCDAVEGPAYQTALVRDLINYIDTVFPTKAERQGRCIGGLSMGGYGAVKLALQYPDLFCSAHSHSGAMGYGHVSKADWPEARRILGPHVAGGGPNDLHRLAGEADRSKCPHLLIDCGTEDEFLAENRSFHAHLENLGLPHEYREFPGGHNWAYWDEHVREAIAFHLPHLGIEVAR